jgi:hypothetical protein
MIGRVPVGLGFPTSGNENQKAEIGVSFNLENIVVGNLPPQMECLSASRMVSEFGPCQIPEKNHAVELILPRPDGGITTTWERGERVIEI